MIFFSMFSFVIPLFIIIAIVYLIVRSRQNQSSNISVYQAIIGYFYFIMAASVITMAIGTVFFVKVAVSQAFDGDETSNDLTLASVLLITGLVICVLHMYGRRIMGMSEEETDTNIKRTYLFIMLGIFSLTGLISLPLAIYQTIHYFDEEQYHYHPQAPSTELAIAIVFVLLWVYFIFRVSREFKQQNRKEIEN